MHKGLFNHFAIRSPRDRSDESLSLQYDLIALSVLQPLLSGFIPLTSSAMRPAALQLLANEAIVNSRRRVVECGSGISTVILASALRETGGTLISIEHDAVWMEKVRQWICDRGLGNIVNFVHAPLQQVTIRDKIVVWYDTTVLDQQMSGEVFDFLVVDGPPAYQSGEEYRRAPALDYFFEYLHDSCAVVLDDINRSAECEIAQSWSSNYDMNFDLRLQRGNVGIARRGLSFYC